MGQPSGFVCKFVRLCALLFLIGGSTVWGQVRPRVATATLTINIVGLDRTR